MPQDDFNAEVGTMSADQLDQLFEGAVEGTPGPTDLNIGSETINVNEGSVEKIDDVSGLFADEDKTPEEIEAEKVKKAEDDTKKAEEEAAKAEEEKNKNKTPEQIAEDKAKADEAEAKRIEAEKSTTITPQVVEALTNTVDFLIKSGAWVEFEGREGLEITPEIYQEIAIEQDKIRLADQFNELVDSTGDYGKAIIAHIKQGGNPDDVIDIFKEQKALESIDVSTEAGKITKIEKYYKELLGWKDKKVEDYVKTIVANDKVDEELTEVNEFYDKHHKNQLAELDRQNKANETRAAEQKETFKTNIKTALEKQDTLTTKERKFIEGAILDFKHDIGGGKRVNDFYLKFAEVQKDPEQYIKLVRFIMDPEGYEKTIKQKAETVAAKKTFTFIKGNSAVKTATGTQRDNDTGGKSQQGTNFSFVRQ